MKKLKDCVDFGNKLAFIKVSMNNNCCYCSALCSGLFEILANLGKSLLIMLVNQFFTYLGYLLIMCGGASVTYIQLTFLTETPVLGMPTDVPSPFSPVIFSAVLSYFMAGLFMDVFELAVLTFMFARNKNTDECAEKFGPGSVMEESKKLEAEIDKKDLDGYMNKKGLMR